MGSLVSSELLAGVFRHNTWANVTLIDFLATLSEDQLELTIPGVYGNSRDTMMHLIGSEPGYLVRIEGSGAELPWPRGSAFPGWDRLREVALSSGEAFERVAMTVDGDPVQRGTYRDEPYAIRTSVLLAQAIDHGTEHRAHIRTILSTHGITPPEIDGWAWLETLPAES
jgi:uncharacterized damage-inducible protein DinB